MANTASQGFPFAIAGCGCIAIFAALLPLIIGLGRLGDVAGPGDGTVTGSTSTSGSIETVDTLDGLTIPFPDTAIGYEQPFCDQDIIGGQSARIDKVRNESCEGDPGATLFGVVKSTGYGAPSFSPSTPEQAKWYMNEPWTALTRPEGSGCTGITRVWAHKKVVITAKATGKSVVASIEECGPNIQTVNSKRRAGGSPDVLEALGFSGTNDSVNQVHIAFAKDQNAALGPITRATTTSDSPSTDKATLCPAPLCKQKMIGITKEMAPYFGTPKYIVLHYLADTKNLGSAEEAQNFFRGTVTDCGTAGVDDHVDQDPAVDTIECEKNNKYIHFVVERGGDIYQLLPENKQGAGAAGFNNTEGGISIHIENVGPPMNQKQEERNSELVSYLMKKYNIPKSKVISHARADILACERVKRGEIKPNSRNPCDSKYHHPDPGDDFMEAVLEKIK